MNSHFQRSAIASVLMLAAAMAQSQVAIMGPNAPALTKEQVANVYLGRNFELKPIDLPEGAALREQFYKKVTERDQSQIKAVWSRIVFTGKGQAPLMLPDATSVKKAVATDPKAIGYIDKGSVDSSVKVVLSLD
ncbi:hypothetical protein [Aquabacterium sp.]|uniref:hypothetical protein n=1 Tax=Aquabacterium sp. TaxID=1872578 RepID=UPI003D6CAEAD